MVDCNVPRDSDFSNPRFLSGPSEYVYKIWKPIQDARDKNGTIILQNLSICAVANTDTECRNYCQDSCYLGDEHDPMYYDALYTTTNGTNSTTLNIDFPLYRCKKG